MEREPVGPELNPQHLVNQVEEIVKPKLQDQSEETLGQLTARVEHWLEFITTPGEANPELTEDVLAISTYLSQTFRNTIATKNPAPPELQYDFKESMILSTVLGRMGDFPVTIHRAALIQDKGTTTHDSLMEWTAKFYSGMEKLHQRRNTPPPERRTQNKH